ncbi:SDR family NAD(P)-dependent oxidoreductase [Streptomyces sp. NPDC058657]|uniref:SDR family NAD(P)-dependent oxidoreductase n=1 Tax=unclassified Streptomyces TaxID=2593676 RepID=UPI00364D1B87
MTHASAGPLAGKTALVIGATSGIGRATAEAFAAAGAAVTLAGRRRQAGEAAAAALRDAGHRADSVHVDVTDDDSVRDCVAGVVDRHGRIDIAFNAAGTIGKGVAALHRTAEKQWQEIIDTNLTGTWRCVKHQAQAMLKQKSGCIITCSSILGVPEGGAYPGLAPYTATKYGIIGLTKVAAAEYAGKGIRVNAVCPAFVQSDMLDTLMRPQQLERALQVYPMRRAGRPEEISGTVVFLASDAASYITGQTLLVDGGYAVR